MQDNRDTGARQEAPRQDAALPFFARFLEGQDRIGTTSATLKFPSDLDEMDHTLKYPSDTDEGDVG